MQNFLDSGSFIKSIGFKHFSHSDQLDNFSKYRHGESMFEGLKKFKTYKERLVTEINRQIRMLR